MSNVNDILADLTLEQAIDGIEKFVIIVEDEIQIHHANPNWMDLDQRCREERNLIVRAGLILDLLSEAMSHFKLPAEHDIAVRIKMAQNYFAKLD